MSHYEQQQERCFRNFTWEEEAEYKERKRLEELEKGGKPTYSWLHKPTPYESTMKQNKYSKDLRDGTKIDVYDILDAFNVENPAVAHAIKKMLCAGLRGYKDFNQDIEEAIESLERAKSFPPVPF